MINVSIWLGEALKNKNDFADPRAHLFRLATSPVLVFKSQDKREAKIILHCSGVFKMSSVVQNAKF